MADRYISEKLLIENIVKIQDLRTLNTKTIGEAISNTPTADVVEVVRCRDCRHFTKGMAVGMCKRIKEKPIIPCCYDNFCKYGERR